MAINEAADALRDESRSRFDKWVAIYIAVLAVLLSVAAVQGENTAKDAAKANLDATNTWAFFQAKNLRRTHYMVAAEQLELRLMASPGPSASERRLIETQLADYRQRIARYTSDKERMEGLDELWVRGKELERVRDAALARDPYFDYAQALLQIAIVLGSVAIVTGGALPLWISAIIATAGVAALVNGQLMIVDFGPDAMAWIAQLQSALKESARPN